MNILKYCKPALLYFLLIGCSKLSPMEEQIRNNINKTVKLDMYKTVRQKNSVMTFEEFKKKFNYISIVYLENGCKPCYLKFIEWQKRMKTMTSDKRSTVLFIIQGNNYTNFMNKVCEIDSIEDQYFTIEDTDYKFLRNNPKIPRWIIDRSLLVDTNNKIKLIGYPFATPEMADLYHNICSE